MIEVGTELPAINVMLTRQDVVRYAGAAGDFNPIHFSDRKAKELGLPGVVVHGMWTMGAALKVVTDWVGDPAKVTDYFVRFVSPIPVPDDDEGVLVEFSGKVVAINDSVATVALEVVSSGKKILAGAKAQVLLD